MSQPRGCRERASIHRDTAPYVCTVQCYLLTLLSPCGVHGQCFQCHRSVPSAGECCGILPRMLPIMLCLGIQSLWKKPSTFCLPFLPGHWCHPPWQSRITHAHRVQAPLDTRAELYRRWMKPQRSSLQGPRAGSSREQVLAAATADGLPRCGAVLPGTHRHASLVVCGLTPLQSDAEIPRLTWS